MPTPIEQATKVLEGLGVESEVIEVLKGTDQAKIDAIKPEEIITTVIDTQKVNLADDTDFLSPVETRIRGEVYGKVAKDFIALNKQFISWEDYNALPEKERNLAMLKLAAKRMNEAIAKGSTDKDLQDKIDELNKTILDHEETIAKKDEELVKANELGDHKVNEFKLNQTVRGTFDTTLGDKLVAKAGLLYPAISAELLSKYDLKLEGENVVLYEKGKATKATKNSKPLALADAFTDIATSQDAIKKQADPPKREPFREKGEPPKEKFEVKANPEFEKALAEREKKEQGS